MLFSAADYMHVPVAPGGVTDIEAFDFLFGQF
jgi:hypothetical protein